MSMNDINKGPERLDPGADFDQNKLKTKADQLSTEGNTLQSLECYTKILEVQPQNEEALEGRLSAFIKLKLFHRCLGDLAVLAEIKPHDFKVHDKSGFVYEQVGDLEKSLSCYLKAYLLNNKDRPEKEDKINMLCHRIIDCCEEPKEKRLDNFENFRSLGKKLYEKGKFQSCVEITKTALMVFCLDEDTSKQFSQELSFCFQKDKVEHGFSEQSDFSKLSDDETLNFRFLNQTDQNSVNEALLDASECCFQIGRVYSAIWFVEKLLENALFSGDFTNEVTAYSKLAFLHGKFKDPDTSISNHVKLLAKCREKLSSNDQLHITSQLHITFLERESLLALCVLFKHLELYKDAHSFAKEYFLKVDMVEHEGLVEAYGILGELECVQGLHEDAIKSHQMELALCERFQDKRGKALAYNRLGKVHQARGNIVLAKECHELHLKIATSLNELCSQAIACGSLGKMFASQNNHEQALTYFDKQLKLASATKHRHLRCQALMSLGNSYKNLRLFQRAESFLKKALLEAQELELNHEYKIKKLLSEVFLVLENSSEALPILLEMLDNLEAKFHRISEYKIVTQHPLLNEFNRCLDDVLILLASAGRVDFALELVERSNAILFHQMLEYKSFVAGSDVPQRHHLSLVELLDIVSTHQKIVMVYRVVKNGYMTWVLTPSHKGVARFHWYRELSETSFQELVKISINGILKPEQKIPSFSCDHRKLCRCSTDVETNCTDGTSHSDNITDFFRQLSKMFVFPIEDILNEDISDLEIVVVKNSFLNLVPFPDLHTSSGRAVHDYVTSVQSVPCLSVLAFLESSECDPRRPIRILGNPEMEEIPGSLPWSSSNSQLGLLEEELSDVSVLLGVEAKVGKSATKEHFLRVFSFTSLLHLSTHGCHDEGIIALAPSPGMNPLAISAVSWMVTLEDIVTLCKGPDVVVLNSCYGMHHRFRELQSFTLNIALALMVAGVKTVVMPTWSLPQKVLLASMREFYNNLSIGTSVSCSLLKTKQYFQTLETFHEPFFWGSFKLYGRDTNVPVRAIQRHSAECFFDRAQEGVLGRFEYEDHIKERTRPLLSKCLLKEVVQLLHHHHKHPTLLQFLQEVMKEAKEILQRDQAKKPNSQSLPYREIAPAWIPQIVMAEKLLDAVGFIMKKTVSNKTILVYPHWNENDCLEKVHSLLKLVSDILSYSPVLADALRVFLSQENKDLIAQFADMLQQILTHPHENIVIAQKALVRMFWLKPSTRRFMDALGFRRIGPLLDFRNKKEDKNVLEACLLIFATIKQFDLDAISEPNPMLCKVGRECVTGVHNVKRQQPATGYCGIRPVAGPCPKRRAEKSNMQRYGFSTDHNEKDDKREWTSFEGQVNLNAPWMSYRANDEENKTKLAIAQRLDTVQSKYKNDMVEVMKWHNDVLETQASVVQSQEKKNKQQEDVPKSKPTLPGTTILQEIKNEKETLDLTTYRKPLTKIKVQRGSSPSCNRVPVVANIQVPLVECVMKRHESMRTLYRCLNEMEAKKREEINNLVTLEKIVN